MADPDLRGQTQDIGGTQYPAPSSFDNVLPGDYRAIATVPWFSRTAVRADAEADFASLERYAWDGEFFAGIPVGALFSAVWADVIALDETDLRYRGSFDTKRVRHVSDVFRGLTSLPHAPVIEGDLDVDFWRYRTFGERAYVKNLCALPAARLQEWRGRYMVSRDAVCWGKAVLVSHFRYANRSSFNYWNVQVRWERRTLSAIGRFVPYHLMCAYNLTETARDRCLVRIPPAFCNLEMCHGFWCEQEPIFSYKSRSLIDAPESGLQVVAYTERVVRFCAALLMAVNAEYKLWYATPNLIAFARELGMGMEAPLGSRGNVRELLELFTIIESTRFDILPTEWRDRTTRARDYHPGRTGAGGDFVYYDQWARRKVSAGVALSRVAATRPFRTTSLSGGVMWRTVLHVFPVTRRSTMSRDKS